MTFKNNRAPVLYYFRFCASFQSFGWIQTGLTVQKLSIWLKISDFFLSCVTLKFDGWPRKTIRHLFYTMLRAVHDLKTCCEFKQELESRNTQFGSKLTIFFILCNLEIYWMTLKNNRAPLLCCLKCCASFHNDWWFRTGVTVRTRQIWVKIHDNLLAGWP